MRIQRLDLIAFGPFCDVPLDFRSPNGKPRLHLVLGANEAGKSSTLRALRAALFGFPHQTRDNFRHDNPKLRVGATLEAEDGRTVTFVRRKGKKTTLYAGDDQTALPDDALQPFLGGIREDEFFNMFAIGHDELQEGGEAVLKGRGRLGEIIFMASAGLPRLRRVEQTLGKEAGSYFLPTGKNPKINDAISRLDELEKTQKSLSLRPETFLQCEADLEQARTELNALEAERAELRRQKARLDRISQAIPTAARLRQLRDKLESLGDVPPLPEHFTRRRESLQQDSRSLDGELGRLRIDAEATHDELSQITVPDALLESAHEIDLLYQRLGSHKTAARDLEQRRAEAGTLEAEIADQLDTVYPSRGLNQIDELRLTRQERTTIREMAARIDKLSTSIRQDEELSNRLRAQITEAERQLEQLGPATTADRLRQIVREASRQGDLDGLTSTAETDVAALARRIEAGSAALTLWSGPAEELLRLPVPSPATIDRFDGEFQSLDQQRSRLEERREEAERSLRETEQSLRREMRGDDVPTEQSLRESRSLRDTGWQEVRRDLEGRPPGEGRSVFLQQANGKTLPDAFESAIRNADEIADRLRHEAERVERLASLQREAEAHQAELDRVATAETDVSRHRESTLTDWQQQWPFLEPLPPREMRDWVARHAELVRLVHEHQSAAARCAELHQRLTEQQSAVTGALEEAGLSDRPSSGLRPLIDVAERFLTELDATAEARRKLQADRERDERDLREVTASLESRRRDNQALQDEWTVWKTRLDLPETTTHQAVLVVVDTLDEIVNRLTTLRSLQERIAGMEANAGEFSADVRGVAVRLAPDVPDRPAVDAATLLHSRLGEARSLRDRRDGLALRHEQLDNDLAAATAKRTAIESELSECCQQAGCDDPTELPAIEQRSAEHRRLLAQIEQAEQELCLRSGGRPLEEFLAEIDAVDADGIALDIEQTARSLDEIDPRHKALIETVANLTQERSRMSGGDNAARVAEDMAALRAQLSADVEQYAALKFAARFLRDGREHYRQKTGNAVLDRASDQFAILTNANFTGLTVDREDDDEPLVGLRTGGSQVSVEGMSDGTTDQLYLALRLAGLSSWIDDHQPQPVFVDDILIQFDDARSIAALRALADLSQRTQVVMFTHHKHIVDLARQTLDDDVLHVHSLDQPNGVESLVTDGHSTGALYS